MRVTPSSPMTGSTQVMQTPMPQAIDSSTATWLGMPALGRDGRRPRAASPSARRRRRRRLCVRSSTLGQHVGDPAALARASRRRW